MNYDDIEEGKEYFYYNFDNEKPTLSKVIVIKTENKKVKTIFNSFTKEEVEKYFLEKKFENVKIISKEIIEKYKNILETQYMNATEYKELFIEAMQQIIDKEKYKKLFD